MKTIAMRLGPWMAGAVALAATGAVHAAPPVADGGADRLAALQEQIVLLKAEAEVAKLRGDIAAASGGPVPDHAADAVGQPQLLLISAYDRHYTALLDVDGRSQRVAVGDTVAGRWSVRSIDADGVELVHGKQIRRLEK